MSTAMTDDLFQAAIWTAVGLLGAAGFAMFNVAVKLQGDGIRPIAANSIKVWIAALVMLTTVALTIEGLPFLIPIEAVALLPLSVLAATVFGDTFILMSQDQSGFPCHIQSLPRTQSSPMLLPWCFSKGVSFF